MQELSVGSNEAGQRMDKYLLKALPNAASSLLYKQLRKKNITLNGKKASGSEMLSLGDRIQCFFSEETFAKFRGNEISGSETMSQKQGPESSAGNSTGIGEYVKAYQTLNGIEVIYEDENILILNKPAEILTQKAVAGDLSLNEWMIGYLLSKGSISQKQLQTFRPSVCNRLDRNTSGIVLCGKSLAGSQALSLLIKERRIGKFYLTLCAGKFSEAKTIHGYLKKNTKTNKVTISVNDSTENHSGEKRGEEIHTRYLPLESRQNITLVEVELITGKTHQIRAHLSSAGHPILGDRKYGGAAGNSSGLPYQLLHARRVVFPVYEELIYEDRQ